MGVEEKNQNLSARGGLRLLLHLGYYDKSFVLQTKYFICQDVPAVLFERKWR